MVIKFENNSNVKENPLHKKMRKKKGGKKPTRGAAASRGDRQAPVGPTCGLPRSSIPSEGPGVWTQIG